MDGRKRRLFVHRKGAPRALRRRVPAYFLALGLGFMAVEIPFL